MMRIRLRRQAHSPQFVVQGIQLVDSIGCRCGSSLPNDENLFSGNLLSHAVN
jgi:hypothetical protein